MRTKVTLILILLNVALFFFIFYLKSGIHEPQDKNGILGPEVVNLQAIEIVASARPTIIRLEKQRDSWMLTSPLQWPANEFAVTTILNELQQLRSEASFAVKDLTKNGQSLADYGLDKPQVVVTLTPGPDVSGKSIHDPIVLRIGDTAKVGNRLYILSPDGERVHVVHRSLAESLLVKLDDLRSNTLFTIPVFEVRSLNLQAGAPSPSKVRIARNDSRWVFETPITARANKSETDVTVSRLNALRVQNFVELHPDGPRLNAEDMTLRVTLEGNGRRETLILGGRVKESVASGGPTAPAGAGATGGEPGSNPPDSELYYGKMEDKAPVFVVAVPATLLSTLRDAQETLRDRRILDVDPAAVTSITISATGQPDLLLQRLESNSNNPLISAWQMARRSDDRGPQTVPADREVVDHLIQHLCELSAEKFVWDAPVDSALEEDGFNRPARRIRIALAPARGANGTTSVAENVVLLLGMGVDHHVYAKLESPNYVYRVSDDTLQQAPVDPLSYRERLLNELPAGAKVTALKLVDISSQAVLIDTPLPTPAPAENAAGSSAPNAGARVAIESLATQLRSLRAKKFIRDEFTNTVLAGGEERPWRYRLDATIALVGGNGTQTETFTLFLAERTGGTTQLVGSPKFNVVFEAEQPLLDALFVLIYGPKDPGPTAPKEAKP